MALRRILYQSVAVFAVALTLAPDAVAQEWLTSFKPHLRCVSEIRYAPSPDLPSGTTRLMLRASEMYDATPIIGPLFVIAPLGPTDSAATIRLFAKLDSARTARKDSLPPGQYVITGRALGYGHHVDTMIVSPDTVTSAIFFLQQYLSGIRCQPPEFRRPNESTSVLGPDWKIESERGVAERHAIPRKHPAKGLGDYRREDIKLVTDGAVCRRAGRDYSGPKSPPRKVIVFQLERAGYLVYDPFEPITAGEFSFRVFYDRQWRRLFGLSL